MGVWGRFVAAGGQRRVTCEQVWYGCLVQVRDADAGRPGCERASKENSTCTVGKNRTDRRFQFGSFGRRVACAGGCVGAKPASNRASERVGLRVLLGLLLYYRESSKSCPSGVGFWLWVGFEFWIWIWMWKHVRMRCSVGGPTAPVC